VENFCDVILVLFFGDIVAMTSLHIIDFLKVRFVILTSKNTIWPNHTIFKLLTSNFKGAGGQKSQYLAIFENLLLKYCILDISQLKFSQNLIRNFYMLIKNKKIKTCILTFMTFCTLLSADSIFLFQFA